MYDCFMEKLVWQKFILGCDNIEYALKKEVGGFIFFSKDIESEIQFINLIKTIKSKSKTIPFLSIDQEGGRVERTENFRPKRLSARNAYLNGENFLRLQSNEISKELYEWGINLNFAPCIDVNSNPLNPIIGERAFSDKADEVIDGMKIFIEESRNNHIIPCVKHYPGHGDADKDSHLTLPQINLPMQEMEQVHIKPFKEAVNIGIEMIMVAHLYCKCFDKEEIPTSLSKNAIQYLRKNIGYQGVLISDDMVMQGVQKYGSLEAVIKGIHAGLDMFIFRDSSKKTLKMIEELCKIVKNDAELRLKIEESNNRIIKLKSRYGLV